jgi:hypothetical protein
MKLYKKLCIILVITSIIPEYLFSQKKDFRHEVTAISFSHQVALFLRDNSIYLATLPMLLAYHKSCVDFMINRPVISSLLLYGMLRYSCDVTLHAHDQKELLNQIKSLKQLALYLDTSYALAKYIQQKHICSDTCLQSHNIIATVTKNTECCQDDLLIKIITTYQALKNELYHANPCIEIESEEIVFLCFHKNIDLTTILYLTKQDPLLHRKIEEFQEDPMEKLPQLLCYLQAQINLCMQDLPQE